MPRQGRRAFLGKLGAFSLIPTLRREAAAVLWNGDILTMDAAQPAAQALAIAGDRLLAVGSNDDVLNLVSARTQKANLGGKTVVPGFIDAHTHPAYSGYRHLKQVDCDLRSIKAIQGALRDRAARTPSGDWIVGFKYDDTKTAEGRRLTHDDLDAVTREHPVFVEHRGGHTAYLNSLAFQRGGVSEQTPDPAGGRFDRDPARGPSPVARPRPPRTRSKRRFRRRSAAASAVKASS